jgi:hypothetical protein
MANDSQFKNVDKVVFNIAGALDGNLRVFGHISDSFNDLELDYLKNWLNSNCTALWTQRSGSSTTS